MIYLRDNNRKTLNKDVSEPVKALCDSFKTNKAFEDVLEYLVVDRYSPEAVNSEKYKTDKEMVQDAAIPDILYDITKDSDAYFAHKKFNGTEYDGILVKDNKLYFIEVGEKFDKGEVRKKCENAQMLYDEIMERVERPLEMEVIYISSWGNERKQKDIEETLNKENPTWGLKTYVDPRIRAQESEADAA